MTAHTALFPVSGSRRPAPQRPGPACATSIAQHTSWWRLRPRPALIIITIIAEATMDSNRRTILATGAAATALAAAPRVLAQQTGQGESTMTFYERGPVRIRYHETGSGFPLLLIAGGGLNSTITNLVQRSPFNPIEEFKGEYRCVASDLRNAIEGESSGPLEMDRPWDAYADDQIGLTAHLGLRTFMVPASCICGPRVR